MELSRPEYWNGQPFPSSWDLPNPGIKPGSPTLQADSLPAEPQGKPKYTGVGSLSLLQWIFPTQESNQGLLHCRLIILPTELSGKPLLLLLRSRFSSVRLCATPETAAHQAPPSLGFSRQEHWSGLPFPSPMHESEKSKGSRSVVSDS